MARINMELIFDELDDNFYRVLNDFLKEASIIEGIDRRKMMSLFRTKIEKGFDHWEQVSDRCVDSGY